jgi:hypothetical protein
MLLVGRRKAVAINVPRPLKSLHNKCKNAAYAKAIAKQTQNVAHKSCPLRLPGIKLFIAVPKITLIAKKTRTSGFNLSEGMLPSKAARGEAVFGDATGTKSNLGLSKVWANAHE